MSTGLSLLDEAFYTLQGRFPSTRHHTTLQDEGGRYANVVLVDGCKYVLCAKGSKNGVMVSTHEQVIQEAENLRTKVVMYVRTQEMKSGQFRIFLPQDIRTCTNTFFNVREIPVRARMINFPLWLGKKLDSVLKWKMLVRELALEVVDFHKLFA